MFRFFGCISLVALLVFGGLHVVTYVCGLSPHEIFAVHAGLVMTFGVTSFFASALRGHPFQYFLHVMIAIMVPCGISLLGIPHPGWAVLLAVVYTLGFAFCMWEEYLDTRLSESAGMFGVETPGLGTVMVDPGGRTRREVEDEVRAVRRPQE